MAKEYARVPIPQPDEFDVHLFEVSITHKGSKSSLVAKDDFYIGASVGINYPDVDLPGEFTGSHFVFKSPDECRRFAEGLENLADAWEERTEGALDESKPH